MRPPLTCRPVLPPELLPPLEPLLLPLPELLPLLLLPLPELLPLPDPPLLPLPLPELLPLLDPLEPLEPLESLLAPPSRPPSDPLLEDGEEHAVESDAAAAPKKTARPDGQSFMGASPLSSTKYHLHGRADAPVHHRDRAPRRP
jgi:hypothetical protein